MIDMQISLLYDFYGQFLTKKQREVMHLYFENDYSLSEIAENLNVSRQAIHDTIKKSKKALTEYENRLGLAEKFAAKDLALVRIAEIAEELQKRITGEEEKRQSDEEILKKLEEIQKIISGIENNEDSENNG